MIRIVATLPPQKLLVRVSEPEPGYLAGVEPPQNRPAPKLRLHQRHAHRGFSSKFEYFGENETALKNILTCLSELQMGLIEEKKRV